MVNDIKKNLTNIVIILGLISSIGVGFSKFAKLELTIEQLSAATAPDLTGIDDNSFSINDNATALAVLEQKIAALENKKTAKPVDISSVVTRSKINEKSIKLLELQIEEIKQSSQSIRRINILVWVEGFEPSIPSSQS